MQCHLAALPVRQLLQHLPHSSHGHPAFPGEGQGQGDGDWEAPDTLSPVKLQPLEDLVDQLEVPASQLYVLHLHLSITISIISTINIIINIIIIINILIINSSSSS